MRFLAMLAVCLAWPGWLQAGLYYSGEVFADLPSQWRGFLVDHRAVRMVAVAPGQGVIPSPLRETYVQALKELEAKAKQGTLTAEQAADLGALLLRMGQVPEGLRVLRQAERQYPEQFRILANLATAWQLQGEWDIAIDTLSQAVRLAPPKYRRAEELHLKLLRLRRAEKPGTAELDDLFGVRYVGEGGKPAIGTLAAAELKKLPPDAVSTLQRLAMWLPSDGRLLWQLAELANAFGDTAVAAAMLDGCVTEFALRSPILRQRRQTLREHVMAQRKVAGQTPTARAEHEGHGVELVMRSPRPLIRQFDVNRLPPITPQGVNQLPWPLVGMTSLGRGFRPEFPKRLSELDSKRVMLVGFMQPLDDGLTVRAFLLTEYPIGCWFCESPEPTSIVLVELPADKSVAVRRDLLKVEGVLKLNSRDPEDFLYTVTDAKVMDVD